MTKPAPTAGVLPIQSLPPIDELALAVGVGALVFLRPWFDGITYPEYNVSFTWACAALAAFWAVMVLVGRMHVRFVLPVSLLAAFLLVAVATAPFTVQYDATYRGLIDWAGYLMLFCAAANGLRARTSIAIVVGCFAVTSIAEAVYAVLHVVYIMPRTRAAVMRDPALLQAYFNTTTMTPELASRMQSNRAYGSLLFANALACWLLTGIPVAIACTNGLYLRLTEMLARPREKRGPSDGGERAQALFATSAVGSALFLAVTAYYTVFFVFAYGDQADMAAHKVRWAVYCFVVPLALTIAASVFASRHGARAMLTAAAMLVCGLFGLTAVYGLGASYSRGGMLASAGSLAVLVVLMYLHKRILPSPAVQRAAAVVLVGAAAVLTAHLAMAQQPPAPANTEAPAAATTLALEGVNPSWEAMKDPATAMLRFGYWISGAHMFAAHPLTGVGLGNFAAAYPRYQVLGAGDVKPAHNDYLQAACETGIFGLIAFLGFWAYFALANARSILRESDRATRWFRAGIFAGVIGFLLHSFVDFNFFNPSLAGLVFALAGTSFAFMPGDAAPAHSRGRLLAAAVLALVAWTFYAGLRVSQADAALGRESTRRVRLAMVDQLEAWVTRSEASASSDPNVPFMAYETSMALLIDGPAARDAMGQVLIPTGPTAYRRAQPGERLPESARRFIQPEARPAVRAAVHDAIPKWISRSLDADAAYPHDPDVSAHLVQWYDKLREYAADPAEKLRAADETVRWSEVCIARSPMQTAYYDALAKALWDRGELETGAAQYGYFDRAIENWRRRTELYPVKPIIWREYAANCIDYGKRRIAAGDTAAGQKLVDEGNRANQHAADLDAQLQRLAAGRG